jgi:hypothetical protein
MQLIKLPYLSSVKFLYMESITLNLPVLTVKHTGTRLDRPDNMDRGWYTDLSMSSLFFKFKSNALSGILLTCMQFSDFAGKCAYDAQFCTVFLFIFESFLS